MTASRLEAATERLVRWIRDDALPLWSTATVDPSGGFYEDLDLEARPRTERSRRIRVLPRQAYVFARAHLLGWHEDGRRLSDHALSFLRSNGTTDDPLGRGDFSGFIHRLRPDGTIEDDHRDTYDHAFVLLACAWRIAAFNDETSRRIAAATLGFLDRRCRHADGSFLEGIPPALPRRQNPHMHLFEAFIALGVQGKDPQALTRAAGIFELFRTRLFDAEKLVLLEFFADDWSVCPETGHLVEPGHMMEWCMLLDQYAAATGDDVSAFINTLYRRAEEIGFNDSVGGLVDLVSLDQGRPVAPTRRTWVQTEHINAALTLARRGEQNMADRAAELIDQLFGDYLSTDVAGGYVDRLGPGGNVISDAMPTSTLYHLIGVAAHAEETTHFLSSNSLD